MTATFAPGKYEVNPELVEELKVIWSKCSLANLPEAELWGDRAVKSFGGLQAAFGFQSDSVKNQFEHFISLLRSHAAVVADRELEEGHKSQEEVEKQLLSQGLEELCDDLMQGFTKWRDRAWDLSEQILAGPWRLERNHADAKSIVALEGLAAFLCVWGEAGNLRFMPELLYFILSCLLDATEPHGRTSAGRSGEFLTTIVRPIYHVIFEEHYKEVTIAQNGADKKVLLKGLDQFLPPDCHNHDDWNELFLDCPQWIKAVPASERYSHLQAMDWCLALSCCKTHREVHSWLAVFVATHRVVLLHLLPFAYVWVRAGGKYAAFLVMWIYVTLWVVSRANTAGVRFGRSICLCMFPAVPGVYFGILMRLPSNFYPASAVIVLSLIFLPPMRFADAKWRLTTMSCPSTKEVLQKMGRWVFWTCLFGAKFGIGWSMFGQDAYDNARLLLPKQGEIVQSLVAMLLLGNNVLCCLTYTQFQFSLACALLGVLLHFAKQPFSAATEDSLGLVPARFVAKMCGFKGERPTEQGSSPTSRSQWSPWFPSLWDKIIDHMRYEDKLDDFMAGQVRFFRSSEIVTWEHLRGDLKRAARFTPPQLLTPSSCISVFLRSVISDDHYPQGRELQWRLSTFARNLASKDLPRPFLAPYIPGITVLIPHYGESILLQKGDLVSGEQAEVPLLAWLTKRYYDEYQAFVTRQSCPPRWEEFTEEHWEKVCEWASMRSQTLWRTVEGMMLYLRALECHRQINYKYMAESPMSTPSSEIFTCMVSMQMYAFFKPHQYAHTELLLQKYSKSLQIAFIDYEDAGSDADLDRIHPTQSRRYFSALIDSSCDLMPSNRRKPRLRIELPGFPILGDGKGDNQNHAIPFSRGSIIQVIDANQGAYFEQMLFLPCALGEFRSKGKGLEPRIVGFAEHITSDIGSLGDFAAGAETAFGSILQRCYAFLGGRMHYGHPDMMNKEFMIQQGGVSKATKTLNLSEDIFAGMDFTLRGGSRNIVHREYMHIAKGRDLGFNTILTFFAKLAAGTGEQLLTRQVLRLGHVLDLPEFLTFYYAHGGYYLNQWLLSKSVPWMLFLWFFCILYGVSCSGFDKHFEKGEWFPCHDVIKYIDGERYCAWWGGSRRCPHVEYHSLDSVDCWEMVEVQVPRPAPEVWPLVAKAVDAQYSALLLFFLLAQSAPLFFQTWIEWSFLEAVKRLLKQLATLSPLHFIFQAKIIGEYISNEIVHGGAKYLPTGRGLPTERRSFIGAKGGLYNDYAALAFYDGARLLAVLILVVVAEMDFMRNDATRGETWVFPKSWIFYSVVLVTSTSWLFSPFIFNPYQFASKHIVGDIRNWCNFFVVEDGVAWERWYDRTQLQQGPGMKCSVVDLVSWAVPASAAVLILYLNYSGTVIGLIPPCASLAACFFVSCVAEKIRLVPWTMFVLLIDIVELHAKAEHWKPHNMTTWIACLLAQYLTLTLLLAWSECVMRCMRCSHLLDLRLWLCAHRLLQDMALSAFILTLSIPFVIFDFCRSCFCQCSLHNILLYRDPGTVYQSEEVGLEGDDIEGSFLRTSFRNREQQAPPQSMEMVRTSAAV